MSQTASFHGSFYARLQNVAFRKQQDTLTFEKQQGKNKNIICRPWSVRIEKNCALGLEHGPRPAASGRTQDLWHSFSQYGPPGRQIIYIYEFSFNCKMIDSIVITISLFLHP